MMREEIMPDKERAKALIKMADELFERVKRIPLEEFPTPNLSDLYDIIHMLLDAHFISQGIKFKSDGAHFELIEEAKTIQLLTEKEESLVQQTLKLILIFLKTKFTLVWQKHSS
jgi:hypothetical protein